MRDVDGVARFLLDRGLIEVDCIIEGRLSIRNISRRNRNFRVEVPGGTGYLIKRADEIADQSRQTLGSEAAFYALCRGEPDLSPLESILPRLAYCDQQDGILATELLSDSLPLWAYYESRGEGPFPVEVARALGGAVGLVHGAFRPMVEGRDPRIGWLGGEIPWVLGLHRPSPGDLAYMTPASYEVLRILQAEDGLGGRLDELGRLWEPGTVIHGDLKSDNVLVKAGPGPAEVRLVDWELVQVGDPAWDLAGALHDFACYWISSTRLVAGAPPDGVISESRRPLGTIQAAIREFWTGYRAALGIPPSAAEPLLDRAVAFSAARLIQSSYEDALQRDDLSSRSVTLLQVGANLLSDPEAGRVELYGIPLGSIR